MAPKEYSDYQKSAISGYYANLETILLQKLGELVTELYLAEKPASRHQLWHRAQRAMLKLEIPPAIIQHIMVSRDVEILAKNLQDWQKRTKKA